MSRLSLACCLAASMVAASAWAEPSSGVESRHAPGRVLSGGPVAGVGFADMGGEVDVVIPGLVSATKAPRVAERWSAGAYLGVRLGERWGARVELRYAERGATATGGGGGFGGGAGIPYVLDFRIAYLELPALATYAIEYDGGFTPYVFAGPDLALRLSGEVEAELPQPGSDGSFTTTTISQDVSDSLARFDAGVTLGAGMKFPLDWGRLVLDLRYTASITRTADDGVLRLMVDGAGQGPGTSIELVPHGLRHRVLAVTAALEL